MKDSKNCRITACYWECRHEILGLVLLVIATFLTIATGNSFGIVAMFLVGGVMCCYRHWCCHSHHHGEHCHTSGEACPDENAHEPKKSAGKSKK